MFESLLVPVSFWTCQTAQKDIFTEFCFIASTVGSWLIFLTETTTHFITDKLHNKHLFHLHRFHTRIYFWRTYFNHFSRIKPFNKVLFPIRFNTNAEINKTSQNSLCLHHNHCTGRKFNNEIKKKKSELLQRMFYIFKHKFSYSFFLFFYFI